MCVTNACCVLQLVCHTTLVHTGTQNSFFLVRDHDWPATLYANEIKYHIQLTDAIRTTNK